MLLPLQTPSESPPENSGKLCLEFLCKARITLLPRNSDSERHHKQTTSNGFVKGAQTGFVIASDDQLEVRNELEEITAHESRSNFVPAGQRLDFRFSPPSTILCLN